MTRREHDLLGDREVPDDAYYGVHTLRARENFPITGTPISAHPQLINGLAAVKMAAARANADLGLLEMRTAEVITAACQEILSGRLQDHFVVDVLQGGAGTSTNMNANEVIANRALEILGHSKGDYAVVHPLEHVNLGQSTNDVYPTAIKVGVQAALGELRSAMRALSEAFRVKAEQYADVVKLGRTQLQDAVPMTVGQELGAFAVMLDEDVERLGEAGALLAEINLGGTAIGTGLNAPTEYAQLACSHLARITGLELTTAADLVEATQDVGAFVQVSGVFKRVAGKLSKIASDLRLLSSGPRAGLGELNLPAVQAGSSIMPGKVNPVIPEVVNQIAHRVIGNDLTVTMAAEGGQLQLNAFEPVIGHALFESIGVLAHGCRTLAHRCVAGMTVNVDHVQRVVHSSIGTAAVLNPHIGYQAATDAAMAALRTGRPLTEVVGEAGLLTESELAEILEPRNLTRSAGAGRASNGRSPADG